MVDATDSGVDTGAVNRNQVIEERGDTNQKSDAGLNDHHNVESSRYPSRELNRESLNDNEIVATNLDAEGNQVPNPKYAKEGEIAQRELRESITQTKLRTHGYVEEGPYKGQLAGPPGESIDSVAAKQQLASQRQYFKNTEVKFQDLVDRDGNPIPASSPAARLPEIDENARMVTLQTPACTVYFRKKGFRSTADTWGRSPALIRAQKLLLKMKARQIAAIENLTKFETIYGVDGNESTKRFDSAANHFRMFFYDDDNFISPPDPDNDEVDGTLDLSGVLEITNFSSLNTSLSLNTGDLGSFQMTLEDPYNLMYVSHYDINLVIEMLAEEDVEVDEVARKYMYEFLAGRPFISAMDTMFVWIATRGERITFSELDEDHTTRFGTERNNQLSHERAKELEAERNQGYRDLEAARADGDIVSESDALNEIQGSESERESLENRRKIDSGVRDYLEGNDGLTNSVDLFGDEMLRRTNIDRQVFEGIVGNVQESYNDGKYTVSISGTNVLRWLQINRQINTPSVVEPFGSLDNPITRSGNWKQGVLSVSGKNVSDSFTIVPGTSRLNVSEYASRHGIPNAKYALTKFDSGSVIAKAVTGLSTPPKLLVELGDPKNVFLRELNPEKLHPQPDESNFWQEYTHQAQGQNRANGWFVPFGLMPPDITSQTFHSFDFNNPRSLEQEIEQLEASIRDAETRAKGTGGRLPTAQEIIDGSQSSEAEEESLPLGLEKELREKNLKLAELKDKQKAALEGNGDPVPTEPIQPDVLELLKAYAGRGTNNTETLSAINSDTFSVESLKDGATSQTLKRTAMWLNDRQENILEPSRAEVVFNLDTNFLVIDLTYLQNPAIRVYNINLPEVQNMFQSDTQAPLDICTYAADQIDWEFFADEAGNVRFRLPQYNSIPLKVYNDYILPALQDSDDNAAIERAGELDAQIQQAQEEREVLINDGEDTTAIDNDIERFRAEKNTIYSSGIKSDVEIPSGALPLDSRTIRKWKFVERNEDIKRRVVKNDSRLYITDDQIITWSFSENEPEFTRVNVSGEWPFNVEPVSSLPYAVTGAAVDFDLWFHYGYRKIEVSKKFIRDARTQAQPYAQQLLARQRQNLLRGTITIIGNPGYRLGDVVYIESRGMLYYVVGVSQSFAWGQGYNTSLTLNYGHAPGVWIANPWDIASAGMWRDAAEGDVFFRESPATPIETNAEIEGSENVKGGAFVPEPPALDRGLSALPSARGAKVDIENDLPDNREASVTITEQFESGSDIRGETVGGVPLGQL